MISARGMAGRGGLVIVATLRRLTAPGVTHGGRLWFAVRKLSNSQDLWMKIF
jgi:hypothetical protein